MTDRLFTPSSARRTLDRVRPAAEKMCRLYRTLERHRPERIASDQRVDRVYFGLVSRLHAVLAEIARCGVHVKDLRQGLLDFPARRGGRTVLLCWKVGEPSLRFWHDAEAGFAGRRPVDEDGPWEES